MDATTSSWPPYPAPVTLPPPDWRSIAQAAVAEHRAIQHSAELAMLLTIADTAQVRTVLEIGTFAGGLTWALAQLPTVQRIITVDRDPQAEAYSQVAALAPKAIMIRAASESPECRYEVREHLDGQMADLVYIDGGSDLLSVTADWQIYGPLSALGGLVAFNNVEPHDENAHAEAHQLWDQVHLAYPSVKISAAPGTWAGLGVIFR